MNKKEMTTKPDDDIKEIFTDLLSNISSVKLQMTSLMNKIKSVERRVNKKFKQLEKDNNKNKGNRKPSGFANPTKISNELCSFMELPIGSQLARTQVTKYIIQYIKDNKLQDIGNAKVIKPNDNLISLLELDGNKDTLTYFNIQRYMNKHFIKEVSE